MATYYVDTAVGNNGNAGTSEGAGNAWATIQYANDNISNGDQVYIKASGDYTEGVTLTAGTVAAWRTFTGYTSTPGDGGKATIDASGQTNGMNCPGFASSYIRFENIIVENATGDGFEASATSYVAFINCEANSNGGVGFGGGPANAVYAHCAADGNTGDGFIIDVVAAAVFCSSTNNGGDGFVGNSNGGSFAYCISSSNVNDGFSNRSLIAVHCTIDGDGKDTDSGIITGGKGSAIVNNIIYDCTTGITGTAGYGGDVILSNLLYSNTANYSNVVNEQDNETGKAPGFTDEAGGDYTLAKGSDARNAGADVSGASSPGVDIGAHQSADAAVIITG